MYRNKASSWRRISAKVYECPHSTHNEEFNPEYDANTMIYMVYLLVWLKAIFADFGVWAKKEAEGCPFRFFANN
jgi:hypothetical protein